MKPGTFLSLFEKLESLVNRLPDGLQQLILREIMPIKTLFLLQRPPLLVLLGDRSASKADLVNALFAGEVLSKEEESLRDGMWQTLTRKGTGALRILDARRPVSANVAQLALGEHPADLFLFVRRATDIDGEMTLDLEHATCLLEHSDARHGKRHRLIGLQYGGDELAREQLHGALHSQPKLESRMIGTLSFSDGASDVNRLVELLGAELPPESQLELARLSGNRVLQRQIAQVVVKSVTAISAAVGAQPIPLADFPILTALQTSMVAGIMHISGREVSARLAGEFMAALGASIGAGLVLREGTRAVVKLVPLWGSAVSSAVAATGTYSIGRAAVAYFVDGVSIQDARSFFKKKKKPTLLR